VARRLRLLHELRLAPGRSLRRRQQCRRPRCGCRRLGPRLRQGRLEGFGRILTRLRLRGVELGEVAALEILSQVSSLVGLHASDLERLIERFKLRRSPSRLAVDSMGSVPAGLCCGSRAAETCEPLVATGYQQYRSHGKTEATPRISLSAIVADLRRDGCISSEKSREDHAVSLQQERFGALHATSLERAVLQAGTVVWGNIQTTSYCTVTFGQRAASVKKLSRSGAISTTPSHAAASMEPNYCHGAVRAVLRRRRLLLRLALALVRAEGRAALLLALHARAALVLDEGVGEAEAEQRDGGAAPGGG